MLPSPRTRMSYVEEGSSMRHMHRRKQCTSMTSQSYTLATSLLQYQLLMDFCGC